MNNNATYRFRTPCCIVGFIDFFFSTLNMLLLMGVWLYLLLVPRSVQKNLWLNEDEVHLLPMSILFVLGFAISLLLCIISIRVISETIREPSSVETAATNIKLWRGFSTILIVLLFVNMLVSRQWLLGILIFKRLLLVTIASVHIYELKRNNTKEICKGSEWANDNTEVEYLSYI